MKKSSSISPRLEVPNSLGAKAAKEITKAINPLVADAFVLYIKLKNFHWHLSGPHFRDYHKLFDEQAEQIFEMIDVLAERVRKVGGLTIRSIGHIAELQSIKDSDELYVDPKKMIDILFKDHFHFAEKLREAHQVCGDHHDYATTSVLEVFIDETERRAWFLFEIAQ